MPVPEEYSMRRATDELPCLTPAAIREFRPRPLHELAHLPQLGQNFTDFQVLFRRNS
jgi:hypothetical protein